MIIKNGRIVSPEGIISADVEVKGGRIKKVAKGIASHGEVVDAAGLYVLPGLIDAHVHLRDPGATHKEDFYTGTCAALAGGFTTVLDMPNNTPAIDSVAALEDKLKTAGKNAVADYGLHFGASNTNFEEARKAQELAAVAALKVFMGSSTGSLLVTGFQELYGHFAGFSEKPVCVHAEDEEAIKFFSGKARERFGEGAGAGVHNEARPPLCAEIAVQKALEIARLTERRLHVCHVSTEGEAALIAGAKKRGVQVTCEASPHHLFLCDKDAEKLGNFGKMNPPLRSDGDRLALWRGLNEGTVDLIASDHAPHTAEEKRQGYWSAPSGVPGLETTLPLLLDAVNKKMLELTQIARLCASSPARVFGIKRKGSIAQGFDADLVLVDLDKSRVVKGDGLQTKCKWSPFEGRELKGAVEKVFLRGQEAFDGQSVTVNKGYGKEITV
jgi:dihydroorotase (multifunctional complex type)